MINIKDQEDLFELISNYLEEDIICVAIGGTAMMFEGYKTTTKDIDLVLLSKADFDIVNSAITSAGYKPETNLEDEFYLTALQTLHEILRDRMKEKGLATLPIVELIEQRIGYLI